MKSRGLYRGNGSRCARDTYGSVDTNYLYYQAFDSLIEPRALMHEIACYGFLSIACYSLSTDINKLIISINAHRRSLDIIRRDDNARGDALPQQRILVDWSHYGDGNGKFT